MSAGIESWYKLQQWPDAVLIGSWKLERWCGSKLVAIGMRGNRSSAEFMIYDVGHNMWDASWRVIALPTPHQAIVRQVTVAAERATMFVNTRRGGIYECDARNYYLTVESEFADGGHIMWVNDALHVLRHKQREHIVWRPDRLEVSDTNSGNSRYPIRDCRFRLVGVEQRGILLAWNPESGEIYMFSAGHMWRSTNLYLRSEAGKAGCRMLGTSSLCGRYVFFVRVGARCGGSIQILDLGDQDAGQVTLWTSKMRLPHCTQDCNSVGSRSEQHVANSKVAKVACICVARCGPSKADVQEALTGVIGLNGFPNVLGEIIASYMIWSQLHVVWRDGTHWAIPAHLVIESRLQQRESQ